MHSVGVNFVYVSATRLGFAEGAHCNGAYQLCVYMLRRNMLAA